MKFTMVRKVWNIESAMEQAKQRRDRPEFDKLQRDLRIATAEMTTHEENGLCFHDYVYESWGHVIGKICPKTDSAPIWMQGFGLGIKAGDILILSKAPELPDSLPPPQKNLFRVLTVKYEENPPDYWSAELETWSRPKENLVPIEERTPS